MKLKSNNPFIKSKAFTKTENLGIIDTSIEPMTVKGTINKSFALISLLTISAAITWYYILNGVNIQIMIYGSGFIGLGLVLAASFKPKLSNILAPGYAFFEGVFIGGVSAFFEMQFPGIVIQAIGGTIITFFVMLGLYRFKIIKVTEKFKGVIIASTFAIFSFYLITWVMGFFMSDFVPIHHGNGLLSIGISVFVIVIAALNLLLDFDQIEKGAAMRAPKYMEWYSAMGLLITLVWLYFEILRLLSKLRD